MFDEIKNWTSISVWLYRYAGSGLNSMGGLILKYLEIKYCANVESIQARIKGGGGGLEQTPFGSH